MGSIDIIKPLLSTALSSSAVDKLFNFEKARNRTRERGLFLIQRLARKDRTSPQSREGLRTEQGPVHRNHPSPDPKSANGRPLAKVFKNLNSAVWGLPALKESSSFSTISNFLTSSSRTAKLSSCHTFLHLIYAPTDFLDWVTW